MLDPSSYPSSTAPPRLSTEMSQAQMSQAIPLKARRSESSHISRLQPGVLNKKAKKTFLKKAFPYLLAGGSTGIGLGIGLNQFIF